MMTIAWSSCAQADVADEVIELTWQRLIQGGEGNHQGLLAEDADGLVRIRTSYCMRCQQSNARFAQHRQVISC